jgi:hypothetical protein
MALVQPPLGLKNTATLAVINSFAIEGAGTIKRQIAPTINKRIVFFMINLRFSF